MTVSNTNYTCMYYVLSSSGIKGFDVYEINDGMYTALHFDKLYVKWISLTVEICCATYKRLKFPILKYCWSAFSNTSQLCF